MHNAGEKLLRGNVLCMTLLYCVSQFMICSLLQCWQNIFLGRHGTGNFWEFTSQKLMMSLSNQLLIIYLRLPGPCSPKTISFSSALGSTCKSLLAEWMTFYEGLTFYSIPKNVHVIMSGQAFPWQEQSLGEAIFIKQDSSAVISGTYHLGNSYVWTSQFVPRDQPHSRWANNR